MVININPRLAGPLDFLCLLGGVWTPRLSQLLGVVAKNEKEKPSKARQSDYENTPLIFFFAKVNVEVTTGHQMS